MLIPPALLKLLLLKVRANLRRAVRVQGNPKRLILLVIGIVAMVLWLGPMVVLAARSDRQPTTFMQDFGPLVLAGFALFALLASTGETAIAFQPAEVDFLFPGPFTRRQLLVYKLLSGMLASLFGAVIFSIMFLRHAGSWPTAFLGILLALWFIQLLGTGVALVKQIVGEMAYTRARQAAIVVVVAGLGALVALGVKNQSFEDLPALLRLINESTAGKVLLAPFRIYTDVAATRTLQDALPRIGLAIGVVALLFVLVVRLDTDYLEASVRASERHAERLRRARSGNLFAPAPGKATRSRSAPTKGLDAWLGGAGPIVWRQSTTLMRSGKRWLFQLLIMLVGAGFILSTLRRVESPQASLGVSAGVLIYLTLILASTLRFDFRADLDHIETLKALPLSPRAIALGELLLPTAMLAAAQALIIAASAWFFHWPRVAIAGAALALPVVNLLLLGVENLLFLMFPARLANRGVADFSLIGRQMLLFMGKTLIFGVIAALAGGAAFGLQLVTDSWVAGFAAAWVVMAAGAVGVVLGVARAFRAFDVSSDMPA